MRRLRMERFRRVILREISCFARRFRCEQERFLNQSKHWRIRQTQFWKSGLESGKRERNNYKNLPPIVLKSMPNRIWIMFCVFTGKQKEGLPREPNLSQ